MSQFARWCLRHRKLVALTWLVMLVGLGGAASAVGSAYREAFTLPDTESKKAIDLLRQTFPGQSGEADRIVIHVDRGTVRDPAVQGRVTSMLERVARVDHVVDVRNPYRASGQISRDGRTAFAVVSWDRQDEVDENAVKRMISIAKSAREPGLRVELGGFAIQDTEQQGPAGLSELVGLIFAGVVLFIAFGSLLAMVLPMVTALVAIGGALFSIVLLTHVFHIANFAPQLAALIGLGVGIDYALFIVTRYRQNVQAGLATEEAIVNAVNTSGRAVLFAGITVCIAVLGMFVLGLSFLYGLAVGAALAVALTMLAALTLLPALLGFFGRHTLSRREQRRLDVEGPHAPELSGS